MADELPDFIRPMLATTGNLTSDSRFTYEIKWDGIRALLFCDSGKHRLLSRNGNDLSARVGNDCQFGDIPQGTVLDGELVSFVDGLPDFSSSLKQHTKKSLVLFDILYDRFEPIMHLSFTQRRERLDKIAETCADVAVSPIYDDGMALFDYVIEHDLEGIVAKRRDAPYEPGKRSDSWLKVKPHKYVYCVIVGYIPSNDGFKSVLVASNAGGGELGYLGKVGTGFTEAKKQRLFEALSKRVISSPPITINEQAVWVTPEIYCKVKYTEFTDAGFLRSGVFVDIVET